LALDFSPRGTQLATAGDGGTVHLWDVATRSEVAVLDHTSPILALNFSPDGNRLATSSDDGTARLWRVDVDEWIELGCKTVKRNLTEREWHQFMDEEREYCETCSDAG
jgi:WD40 repeat protein